MNASSTVPALRARELRVRLGGREIVNVDALDIAAAQWTAVVGPNGAGKTTLLKALAHLLPHAGHVALLGRDMREWPMRQRAASRPSCRRAGATAQRWRHRACRCASAACAR